ncbi:MAG: hypothetical protein OXE79_05505 [Acidimicrobiaceae bacterium]|nr:hypothetical protein [Acidimicrobiaceae bacterium]MCY4175080.1 hypothetical protein [Acidimicrobiaceae bacterium]MCY4293965.1 hypothetical protein [Acidimicrobiaceae bacterium]
MILLTGEAARRFHAAYWRWVASGYDDDLSPYLHGLDELEAR